jgi:hypothetical protein
LCFFLASIKGQLVELLLQEKGVKHVSPGEALREAIKNQTPAGAIYTIYIERERERERMSDRQTDRQTDR